MSQTDEPRHVRVRRWVMAGAVATGVAGSASWGEAVEADRYPDHAELTQQSPIAGSQLIFAAAEGGGSEGEGEGRAPIDPEVKLLADLGFMQGHAYAGLQLYRMGQTELGTEHIGHPIVEKYEAVAAALEKIGFSELKDQLVALSRAAEAKKPVEEVAALYDRVSATIAKIRAKAGGGAAAQLKALVLLTRIAADEYRAAFDGAKMVNAKEYQDSWGFLQIVKAEARALSESSDRDVATVAKAIASQAEKAEDAYTDVWVRPIADPAPSLIYGAAARMEIAANRLR